MKKLYKRYPIITKNVIKLDDNLYHYKIEWYFFNYLIYQKIVWKSKQA